MVACAPNTHTLVLQRQALKNGSHSIPAKWKLSTRLVDNYRKWTMPISLSLKYCFACLGRSL